MKTFHRQAASRFEKLFKEPTLCILLILFFHSCVKAEKKFFLTKK